MGKHDGFFFPARCEEAARLLPDAERLAYYEAVILYGLTGQAPEGKGVAQAVFAATKKDMDAAINKRVKHDYPDKRRGNGEGRKRQSQPADEMQEARNEMAKAILAEREKDDDGKPNLRFAV